MAVIFFSTRGNRRQYWSGYQNLMNKYLTWWKITIIPKKNTMHCVYFWCNLAIDTWLDAAVWYARLYVWTLGLYPQTPVTSVHVCTSEPLDCTPKPQWQVCMSISLNPGLYPQTPVTCVHVCTSEPLDCIPKPQWQVCMSAHLNPGIVPWNPSDKCACLYIWTLGFCPQTPVTSRQNWYMYNITKLQNWHGAYNTMWTTQSHFLTSVITKPVWNFPDLIGYTNL